MSKVETITEDQVNKEPIYKTVVMVAGDKSQHHAKGEETIVSTNLVSHFKKHGFTVKGEKATKQD